MSFSAETFLLTSELAHSLYQQSAAPQPVHDFFTLFGYRNPSIPSSGPPLLTHWLGADPRLNLALQRQGIILSDAQTDQAAFERWGHGLWQMSGSPWYLNAQLALHHSFGVSQWLSPSALPELWEQVRSGWDSAAQRPQRLPLRGELTQVHTLRDPANPVEGPQANLGGRPVFCPDQVLALDHPGRWNAYLNRLQALTDSSLEHFIDLLNVLQQRVDHFAAQGCRLAVHHLSDPGGVAYTDEEINFFFHKLRLGHPLEPLEQIKLRNALLHHLLSMYHEQAWVLYLVLGVHPADEGSPLPHLLDDQPILRRLFRQIDLWDQDGVMPRLILYLPGKPELAAHLIGHYPAIRVRPTIDLSLPQGPATLGQQFEVLLESGLLMDGMGFASGAAHPLALVRHDYARRVLCSWLAQKVAVGHLPNDDTWLHQILHTWTHAGVEAWLGS